MKFTPGQPLLFEDMAVSFHSHSMGASLIRIADVEPKIMTRLKRRHDFYVDVCNTAYLRVDTNKLLPHSFTNNKEAAYLLEDE